MVLLKVYFKSRALRGAALKAAAQQHGEDGWVASTDHVDLTEDRNWCAFEASINCTEKLDAVKTWAGLQIAFTEAYGEILERTEAVPEFSEMED